MSLFLLYNFQNSEDIVVIGEILDAKSVSGYNINPHIKISFMDKNVLEFINLWIHSNSMIPVDKLDKRDIYIYDIIDGSIITLQNSVNPCFLTDEKDWYGNLIIGNVVKLECNEIADGKYHKKDSFIKSLVISWRRDKKLNQIIG